jgi:hypothetical protein
LLDGSEWLENCGGLSVDRNGLVTVFQDLRSLTVKERQEVFRAGGGFVVGGGIDGEGECWRGFICTREAAGALAKAVCVKTMCVEITGVKT